MKKDDDMWCFKSRSVQEVLNAIIQDVQGLGYELHDRKPFRINHLGVVVYARKIHSHRNPLAWKKLSYPWLNPPPYDIRIVKDKIMKNDSVFSLGGLLLWFHLLCLIVGIMFSFTSVLFFVINSFISFLVCMCIGVFFLTLFCIIRH